MTKIPLSEFLAEINIEKVVTYYKLQMLKSKRLAKKEFVGLCPFHDDQKNSFSINATTGKWICYTCDIGGNILEFVKKMENIDTNTAIKKLKQISGEISLEDTSYTQRLIDRFNDANKIEPLKAINLPANFKNAILYYSKVKSRVDLHMIKKFDIRYTELGFYTGYMIIPIRFEGKVVAYFARDMMGTAKTSKRYNEGCETSRIFFNYDMAIKNTEYVVLTEGIIDAMYVDRFGYNAMALLGLHISDEKLELLKQFKKIYLCLDNDTKKRENWGQKAANKLGQMLKTIIPTYNILLPENTDPDECTKEQYDVIFQNARIIV